MDIYLPIAGLSVNALLMVALGGLVGVVLAMVLRPWRGRHAAAR